MQAPAGKESFKDTTHKITQAMQQLKAELDEKSKTSVALQSRLAEKTRAVEEQAALITSLKVRHTYAMPLT